MTTRSGESLPPSYFDRVYADAPDPWSFATSEYEQEKYAVTLAELPRERYRSAFEIGCSIGVLTEQLAARCDALLSVDVAERALAQARARCVHLPHVRCERLRVPEAFPDEQFDLIVVSEVGYYWSLCGSSTRPRPDRRASGAGRPPDAGPLHERGGDYPISGDAVHDGLL